MSDDRRDRLEDMFRTHAGAVLAYAVRRTGRATRQWSPGDRRGPFSTEEDLTKVLGIEGSVNVDAAVSLELQFPDGTIVAIPLHPDGRYEYLIPKERQDELFTEPGGWWHEPPMGTSWESLLQRLACPIDGG